MTDEPNGTEVTQAALGRATGSERDYVNGQIAVLVERLAGIDRATKVYAEQVNRVPTDVTTAVGHLRELTDEKFTSVQTQFKERDTRSERESKDNKVAVDAAFAAQKEAAAKQDEGNQKSIDKSENMTNDRIAKLADLFETRIAATDARLADVKSRVDSGESNKRGGQEAVTERRQQLAGVYALGGFIIALLLALIAVAAFVK